MDLSYLTHAVKYLVRDWSTLCECRVRQQNREAKAPRLCNVMLTAPLVPAVAICGAILRRRLA